MKKLIAFLLAAAMCLCFAACGDGESDSGSRRNNNSTRETVAGRNDSSAAEPVKDIPRLEQELTGSLGDTVAFVLGTDGTLTISGEGKMQSFDYEDGVVDTPWFEARGYIQNVVIEEGITNISAHTFYKCFNMESIVIPSTVRNIGAVSFCECKSLKEIVIPEGVTMIGNTTFEGCTSLTKAVLPESLTSIAQYAFYGCGLTSIEIPDSVTFIGSSVFASCEDLTIIGAPGSCAETYAKDNSISFQAK